MTYKIIRARIANDGTLTTGERAETICWPTKLRVGGLYALRPGKLYKVLSETPPDEAAE